MDIRHSSIKAAIYDLIEPKLKWRIGDLNLIRDIQVDHNQLTLTIQLITDNREDIEHFRESALECLKPFSFEKVFVRIERVDVSKQGLQYIRQIILVSSGKGGVGKSTIAVNIAATLVQRGHAVGLMDADIYGPSVPALLGITEKPQVLAEEVLMPVSAHGIKTMSIGLLVPLEKAIAWRGQLVSGTVLQFIRKVNWGTLDFLIVDMPPGTGDIQLTIASELEIYGVIIVTMPQQIVIGDVIRSITMYREHEVPIIGIVQNMVTCECEKCGHQQNIFSGQKHDFNGIPTISSLPLDRRLWECSDEGVPYVINNRGTPVYEEFEKIALSLEIQREK